MSDKVVEAIEIQNFEEATIKDAKKVMQNMFNDITPEQFEELKKQAIENVKQNNMSARDMFEELGYEKIEDALTIQYIDKFNNQTRFWKNAQMIEMFGQKITDFDTENNEYYYASFKLFKAINKQIEELGWK